MQKMLLTEHAQMVCENSAYCTLNHFLTHLASHPRGGGLERKRRNPRMPLKSVYMSHDSLHLFNDVCRLSTLITWERLSN